MPSVAVLVCPEGNSAGTVERVEDNGVLDLRIELYVCVCACVVWSREEKGGVTSETKTTTSNNCQKTHRGFMYARVFD